MLAIDAEQAALERLCARAGPAPLLTTSLARFETVELPPASLVNASFSLPFCRPRDFPRLWAQVASSLARGGRFAGHLFGQRDGWAGESQMSFHSRAEVVELLTGFAVEELSETEEDGTTAKGKAKHWHVFGVVARRLAAD